MEQSVRSPSMTWLCRFRFRFSRDEHLQQLKTTFREKCATEVKECVAKTGVEWCKTEDKKKF
jgi:hypothetical protein